jgi:acyl-coenzyme A synthetase/AMP-(fatty) acid ligase
MEHKADGISWRTDGLWTLFSELLAAQPEAVAAIAGPRRARRQELAQRSEAVAGLLSAHGVGQGHRILAEAHNSVDSLVVGLAVSRLGAVFCPQSPKLDRNDRRVIIERLAPMAMISRERGEGGAALPGVDGPLYVQWGRAGTGPAAGRATPEEEDPLSLIGFTAGTTGVPKAVQHSASALNYAAKACAAIAGVQLGEPILNISPFGSAPGWTFNGHMSLAYGLPLVIMSEWDPRRALELITEHGCAWAMGVPSHLHAMVELARSGQWTRPLTSMRAMAVGGSANSAELIQLAKERLGLEALRMFGMSECLGHASPRLSDPPERKLHYDGVPFPGTSLEAYDENGRVLPRGQVGQAGVRGPSLFKGYVPGLGAEQTKMTPDGALLTGDLLVRDEKGFVRIVGRVKDQIIRGGLNMDPAEVELALSGHPAVLEVAVVGRPDPRLGERICAVLVPRPGQQPSLAELVAHLEGQGMAKYKWPEFLQLVDRLPKTEFGKVDKKLLRQRIAQEGGPSGG